MYKGIYCLVLENPACNLTVGSLGEISFPEGYHVYTGSARGPGGLARVTRHIRYSRGAGGNPRWHIDYLLGSRAFRLDRVICGLTEDPLECRMAQSVPGTPVPGFGCSDCRCKSHLFFFPRHPGGAIIRAMESLPLFALSKTIKT